MMSFEDTHSLITLSMSVIISHFELLRLDRELKKLFMIFFLCEEASNADDGGREKRDSWQHKEDLSLHRGQAHRAACSRERRTRGAVRKRVRDASSSIFSASSWTTLTAWA